MLIGGVVGASATYEAVRREWILDERGERTRAAESGSTDVDRAQDASHADAEARARTSTMSTDEARTLDVATADTETLRAALLSLRRALAATAQDGRAANANAVAAANPQASKARRDPVSVYPATQDELEARARNCELQLDLPPVFGMTPGEVSIEQASENGLSSAEQNALNDAFRRMHTATRARLRALYTEAIGDEAGAANLTAHAILQQLRETLPEGEHARINQRIARELAGLQPQPADLSTLSAYEQALRLFTGSGTELETTLAMTLGADRSRELRAAKGGWPWSRWGMSGCPDER